MLDAIRKLIKKPDTTAAALRSAHAEIDLPALMRAVTDIEQERSRALVEATDDQITAIEARLAQAKRDLDRGHAASKEIQRRITEAERAEALTAFRAERRKVNREAEQAAQALRERYPALARELVAVLGAARDADLRVREWNQARNGADPDGVTDDELRPIEPVEARIFDGHHPDGFNGSYVREVKLPNIDPTFAPAFNDFTTYLRGDSMKVRAA